MSEVTFSNINHLLIDLGGVLLELDFPAMNKAFAALRPRDDEGVHYALETAHDIFHQLETGVVGEKEFVSGLRDIYDLRGDDNQILEAWKQILGSPFPGRAECISKLRPHFNMALLSNTNHIHYQTFEPACRPIFSQLDRLFVSHEMGTRKPQPEMYLTALETMGWKAEETLFIDDTPANIEAAQKLHIEAVWLQDPTEFEALVDRLIQARAKN